MNANREERIASFVVAAFSLAYFVGTFLIPVPTLKQQMGPSFFPKGIGVAMPFSLLWCAWQVSSISIGATSCAMASSRSSPALSYTMFSPPFCVSSFPRARSNFLAYDVRQEANHGFLA